MFLFVKYFSENIKLDVSEYFFKNELILVLLVLSITYEKPRITMTIKKSKKYFVPISDFLTSNISVVMNQTYILLGSSPTSQSLHTLPFSMCLNFKDSVLSIRWSYIITSRYFRLETSKHRISVNIKILVSEIRINVYSRFTMSEITSWTQKVYKVQWGKCSPGG